MNELHVALSIYGYSFGIILVSFCLSHPLLYCTYIKYTEDNKTNILQHYIPTTNPRIKKEKDKEVKVKTLYWTWYSYTPPYWCHNISINKHFFPFCRKERKRFFWDLWLFVKSFFAHDFRGLILGFLFRWNIKDSNKITNKQTEERKKEKKNVKMKKLQTSLLCISLCVCCLVKNIERVLPNKYEKITNIFIGFMYWIRGSKKIVIVENRKANII